MRKARQLLPWLALLLAMALFAGAHGLGKVYTIDYYPVNGDFQNYNPVRHLLAGQVPYRDFTIYLGAGELYSVAGLLLLIGNSFGKSMLASNFLTWFSFELLVLAVFAALFPRRKWVPAAVGLTCAGCFWFTHILPRPFLTGLLDMALNNGPSVKLLRMACLPMAVLLILLGLRLAPKRAHWLVPVIAGALVPWSNDMGAAMYISVSLAYGLFLIRDHGWRLKKLVPLVLLYILKSVGGLLASVLVVSWGHPLAWLHMTRQLSSYQSWFFEVRMQERFCTIWELRIGPAFWVCLGLAALCGAGILLAKERANALRWAAGLALLGAMALYPLLYCLMCGKGDLPLGGIYALSVPMAAAAAAGLPDHLLKKVPLKGLISYLPAGLSCAVLLLGLWAGSEAFATYREPRPEELTLVPKLGGYLADKAIRLEKEETMLDGRRVLSTYAGAVEVLTDQLQPGGIDYIIHALGDDQRAAWLNTMNDPQVEVVSVVAYKMIGFERWIRNANWWFYRELYRNWTVCANTYQTGGLHVFYSRAEGDQNLNQPISLEIQQTEGDTVTLLATARDPDFCGVADVTIRYQVTPPPLYRLKGGIYTLLFVTCETEEQLMEQRGGVDYPSYFIPAGWESYDIPITISNGAGQVTLHAYPAKEAALTVSEAQVNGTYMDYSYFYE